MERRMMREKVGSKIACSSENGDRKEREWILTLESEWGGGLLPERRNKPKLMQFYCAERERKTFVLDLWRRRMPYCIFSFFFLVQLHLLLTLWFFTGAHSKSLFFFMTPQQIIFFLYNHSISLWFNAINHVIYWSKMIYRYFYFYFFIVWMIYRYLNTSR